MVKPIVKDVLFLGQKSEEATKEDLQIATDLEDTLKAHRSECVGMAANMIGYKKRIIIVSTGFLDMIMTLTERANKAVEMKLSGGYNCSQAVTAVLADQTRMIESANYVIIQ